MLDAPESGAGRGYGRRHLLQLKAIRILQAHGLPLSRIQQLLFARSDKELEQIAESTGEIDPRPGNVHSHTFNSKETWTIYPLTVEIFLPMNVAVPDRDFVLRWRRASRPDLQSIGWISSDREETYALIQLPAPDDVPTDREGSDLYFLVDRSGSMAGEKWAKTADALIAFVKATTQHDRVWITFFESDYRDFTENPWGATCCCGTRISNPLPNSARAGAPNYSPRCAMSLEFINDFRPGAAAVSFSSRTARSPTRRLF